jgi:hypothetical protein
MRMMPLPDVSPEYRADMEAGRRVELRLSSECLLTLQYFPEFDNISLSFYTKNMPGFTIGVRTEDWPMVQRLVADFDWRGRRQ